MALADQIEGDVSNIITTAWNVRTGQVVPTTTSVALAGGAVELDATYLYADLANSSRLAKMLHRQVAAKILKSFLATTTRLIGAMGGTVISFDGDRVLGVFLGKQKNTSAARCGLHIKWCVQEVIRTKFEAAYSTIRDLDFEINHGVGMDTGTILVVRAGARGTNDLISIGRAPSLAAKLSDLREGNFQTFITAAVYNVMHDGSKYSSGSGEKKNMWERRTWQFLDQNIVVYRSAWMWEP